MTNDDAVEVMGAILAVLAWLVVWRTLLRFVLIDALLSYLFRLRDELRSSFAAMDASSRHTQLFSFEFLQRAINCAVADVHRMSVWDVFVPVDDEDLHGKFRTQVDRFRKERSASFEELDRRYRYTIVLILLVNSPLAPFGITAISLCKLVWNSQTSMNPAKQMETRISRVDDFTHRQSFPETAFFAKS